MIKPDDPKDLVINLLPRSICSVQVASVITDRDGRILSWGWNNMGPTGYGICAERHAISRGNRNRYKYGTIYVAGRYARNNHPVNAVPCDLCQAQIESYEMTVLFRNKMGEWV